MLLSLPELKAHVSFSDQNSFVCRHCCRHKLLTFPEPGVSFNQTWHKALLGKDDLNLLK